MRKVIALLTLATCCLPLVAQSKHWAGWDEITTPHFTVYSRLSTRAGRSTALEFEQIRAVFQQLFPTLEVDPGKPFHIFLVEDKRDMVALLPSFWGNPSGKRPSGVFQPGFDKYYAVVLVERAKFSEPVVFHEYVHLVNNMNFPVLPLWLNEGLAEFFEQTSVSRRGVTIGNMNAGHARRLYDQPMQPLADFFLVDHQSREYHTSDHSRIFYAQSWALTHYFLMDPVARERGYLTRFMEHLAFNRPLSTATSSAFGDVTELEREIVRYVRKNRFPKVTVKLPVKLDAAKFPVRPVASLEMAARVANFFAATHEMERGHAMLRQLRRRGVDHPLVDLGFGMVHLRRNNPQAALTALEAVLAVDQENVTANYFAGRALNMTARQATAVNRAEFYLAAAIQVDPRFAPAYSELASLYSTYDEHRHKALPLVEHAVALERGNLDHRYVQFDVLMRSGQVDAAVKAAQLMLDIAPTAEARASIRDLLQSALDRQNR